MTRRKKNFICLYAVLILLLLPGPIHTHSHKMCAVFCVCVHAVDNAYSASMRWHVLYRHIIFFFVYRANHAMRARSTKNIKCESRCSTDNSAILADVKSTRIQRTHTHTDIQSHTYWVPTVCTRFSVHTSRVLFSIENGIRAVVAGKWIEYMIWAWLKLWDSYTCNVSIYTISRMCEHWAVSNVNGWISKPPNTFYSGWWKI